MDRRSYPPNWDQLAYTPSALLAAVTDTVEQTLWQAMRGIEETSMLFDQMTRHFKTKDQ